MINGKRVVAFTPYGRQRTVSILKEYMLREHLKGVVDEWWLCSNVDANQVTDLRYMYQIQKSHKDWIKIKERPRDVVRLTPKQRNTGYFYRYMTDPNTVYVRFDDDIIYLHEDAVTRLVEAKLRMGSTLTCFAYIWNNAICSWFGQKHGKIPGAGDGWPEVEQPYCMDSVGWSNGEFAVLLHELLLGKIEDKKVEDLFLYQDIPLAPRQQFSVSCFAVDGVDYAVLEPPGHLDYPEEEHWHTVHRPEKVNKDNVIVGDALVSHFTFFPQQKEVFATDILDRYRKLAEALNG